MFLNRFLIPERAPDDLTPDLLGYTKPRGLFNSGIWH